VRERLLDVIFPEIGVFVGNDLLRVFSVNLRNSVAQCSRVLLGVEREREREREGGRGRGRQSVGRRLESVLSLVSSVVSGSTFSHSGRPISFTDQARVWSALARLNRNPSLSSSLSTCVGSPHLASLLTTVTVLTPTSLSRSLSSYTQARNTPFASLAAQAAAVAGVGVREAGGEAVVFVHDAFVVRGAVGAGEIERLREREREASGGLSNPSLSHLLSLSPTVLCQTTLFRRILVNSFAAVLGGSIPIQVSMRVSERWGGEGVDM
jgi:hypothetical protein